jgi:hypothetical protein
MKFLYKVTFFNAKIKIRVKVKLGLRLEIGLGLGLVLGLEWELVRVRNSIRDRVRQVIEYNVIIG